MTKEQYERWKDFALRMARKCFRCHRRPSRAWIVEQVEHWFHWRDYQEDWDNYSSWDQDRYPLCDHITEFYDDMSPRCWPSHDDWREEDRRTALAEYQFDEQWLGPVRCCIRAGIDVAAEPSAGVCGFTVGDLRSMYPEGIPDWVQEFFAPGQLMGVAAVCPGVGFLPTEPVADPRTFDELPDDQGVWL